MEFKAFTKIERIGKVFMRITQKIHGTNAQVSIIPTMDDLANPHVFTVGDKFYHLLVGSRTRWITPEDDNYGFAKFVYANAIEFIEKLGPGVHFGEWAGPGINSGEGLTEKTFVLFDYWKFPEGRPLPPQTKAVPVLYEGPIDASKIDEVMADLKANGSKLSPGFMRPEGVVVQIAGERYKKVFEVEETQWTGAPGDKKKREAAASKDYGYLCQPVRLEKLLSRDEAFMREYPQSLPVIVKEYFADLIAEGQIAGTDDEVKAAKKGASSLVFNFVRTLIDSRAPLPF